MIIVDDAAIFCQMEKRGEDLPQRSASMKVLGIDLPITAEANDGEWFKSGDIRIIDDDG